MDRDSKAPALKSLQGKVWESGYGNGTLRSQIYDDAVSAIQTLKQKGRGIFLYSSGSVLAQKLLIAHSEHGDLSSCIDGYFDTATGPKIDPQSYQKIAAAVQKKPAAVLFISDVVSELSAAKDAGMMTLLSLRPGNAAQKTNPYQSIHSFDMLLG
jgi:enolase-phosphatase E1